MRDVISLSLGAGFVGKEATILEEVQPIFNPFWRSEAASNPSMPAEDVDSKPLLHPQIWSRVFNNDFDSFVHSRCRNT